MSTPEGKIQKEALSALKKAGVFCWRNNNTAIFDPKMNGYRSFNGLKGVPDILAVINGRFTGIEVKTPRGRQSADQVLFQQRCERHGGKYYIVRSKEDVEQLLRAEGLS